MVRFPRRVASAELEVRHPDLKTNRFLHWATEMPAVIWSEIVRGKQEEHYFQKDIYTLCFHGELPPQDLNAGLQSFLQLTLPDHRDKDMRWSEVIIYVKLVRYLTAIWSIIRDICLFFPGDPVSFNPRGLAALHVICWNNWKIKKIKYLIMMNYYLIMMTQNNDLHISYRPRPNYVLI